MLSVVDLLEAGTLPVELAVYLLAAIRGGASFMIGVLPGGAGKTTVMVALLNFVPPDAELHPAGSLTAIQRGLDPGSRRACCVGHEIGAGNYFAYLWGPEPRSFFSTAIEQACAGHESACRHHGAGLSPGVHRERRTEGRLPADAYCSLLETEEGHFRVPGEIVEVWESDGHADHQVVYQGRQQPVSSSRLVDTAGFEEARRLLATFSLPVPVQSSRFEK